jgi:integrase
MGMLYKRGQMWWIKYYVNGRPVWESTGTDKETPARNPLEERDGVANGTINRELATLIRMLGLAYDNKKVMLLPVIPKPTEAKPRAGFFEPAQFAAVRRHLRPDLQVAVTIAYQFGWRMQSEVLALMLSQVDLTAGTLRWILARPRTATGAKSISRRNSARCSAHSLSASSNSRGGSIAWCRSSSRI